jgi:hypothetical protein
VKIEAGEVNMRIYEGSFAYEIEPALDPGTQISKGWRFNIYRVRPQDQLLRSETAATREEAERAGKQALAEVMKAEQRNTGASGKSAA